MLLLIAYLLLALVVSFLCSIMESVLLSVPQPYVLVKQQEGLSWAKHLQTMKDSIDQPLSAILSLNTVAHTIGAAGVGAQAVEVFGQAYFGLISAILTILILVITEIIPKTIGARFWKSLAPFTSFTIRGMIVITYPLVRLSSLITAMLSNPSKENTTSREEIAALARIGAKEGVFSQNEKKVIQNILKLQHIKAVDIMTPRVVVAVADQTQTLKDFLVEKDYLRFSRIPIYENSTENITGYVIRQTVFEKLAEDQHHLTLQDIKREIQVFPNSLVVLTLWEKLLESKEHIALIVDEYGGLEGIVTMEDIIETMLGLEILDEKDTITDMQKFARERWQTRQMKYQHLLGNSNTETDK